MKRRTRRKVKKVKILGEVVSKGGSRYKFLLGERRHFLRRQRDPESSYYGVPISELLKSNRRKKTRCWKGYKPVKGKRPYSKGSCRKVRRNKMRSRNSMGQKLYVVITTDGTPLSGRIGTIEPPGPIFYTKGEAIKKGRMFRGRVVSVESYYKMRPGLRRNPGTTKVRPIPGMFYRVYWSHPSRGETAPLIFKGEQLLKLSISDLSRYWPLSEGLKMAKVHFGGPFESWDSAFMNG